MPHCHRRSPDFGYWLPDRSCQGKANLFVSFALQLNWNTTGSGKGIAPPLSHRTPENSGQAVPESVPSYSLPRFYGGCSCLPANRQVFKSPGIKGT
jgi:hypothetical protein